MAKRILLAGESWTSTATHIKGWDQFPSVTHHRGADAFIAALSGGEYVFDYMLCHEAAEGFPSTPQALDAYDAIILSDIGANTLLLPPQVWIYSQRAPNRLKLLRDYVERGGGLVMVGGYYSFQGSTARPAIATPPSRPSCPSRSIPMTTGSNCPRASTLSFRTGLPAMSVLAGLPGDLPYCLGSTKPCSSQAQRRCSPCRLKKAVIPCSRLARPAAAEPPRGPPTSVRIGCQRVPRLAGLQTAVDATAGLGRPEGLTP